MSSTKKNKPVVKVNSKITAVSKGNEMKAVKPTNKPAVKAIVRLISSNNVWPD